MYIMVKLYFDYCSVVWGNSGVKNTQTVFYCMQAMEMILISGSRHSAGENLDIKG